MRALRRGLTVVFCTLALFATTRAVLLATTAAPHSAQSVAGGHSLATHPAPPPQVGLAAPTAVTGPTTVHVPIRTREFLARPALRGLLGVSSRLLVAPRPAPHLADTPLLI